MVNLLGDLGRLVQAGDVARNLRAHVGEDIEVAIAECVMQQHAIALRDGGRTTDDVDDRDVLRICAGQAVDGRQFSYAKGGHKS
jgi:hypothetical protein